MRHLQRTELLLTSLTDVVLWLLQSLSTLFQEAYAEAGTMPDDANLEEQAAKATSKSEEGVAHQSGQPGDQERSVQNLRVTPDPPRAK